MSNPIDNPDDWGRVYLGGVELPGVVLSVDGCVRAYEWQHQKAQGTKGATSIFKGAKIAESIEVVMGLSTPADFAAAFAMNALLTPPDGKPPPNFAVQNQIFTFNKIARVSTKEQGQITPGKGNAWTWKLSLFEHHPSAPVVTGTATKAAGWNQGNPPSASDASAKQIDDLVRQIKGIA